MRIGRLEAGQHVPAEKEEDSTSCKGVMSVGHTSFLDRLTILTWCKKDLFDGMSGQQKSCARKGVV